MTGRITIRNEHSHSARAPAARFAAPEARDEGNSPLLRHEPVSTPASIDVPAGSPADMATAAPVETAAATPPDASVPCPVCHGFGQETPQAVPASLRRRNYRPGEGATRVHSVQRYQRSERRRFTCLERTWHWTFRERCTVASIGE